MLKPPYLLYLKIGAALAILAAVGYGLLALYHAGYHAGANQVHVQWDADKIRAAEAQKAALLAYATQLNQAQEQHDHDQATIDTLAGDARRLRIHLPTCGNAAAAGQNPDGSTGAFPAGVDQLFADFQERVGGIIRRCDQLNIDAIRANGSR